MVGSRHCCQRVGPLQIRYGQGWLPLGSIWPGCRSACGRSDRRGYAEHNWNHCGIQHIRWIAWTVPWWNSVSSLARSAVHYHLVLRPLAGTSPVDLCTGWAFGCLRVMHVDCGCNFGRRCNIFRHFERLLSTIIVLSTGVAQEPCGSPPACHRRSLLSFMKEGQLSLFAT